MVFAHKLMLLGHEFAQGHFEDGGLRPVLLLGVGGELGDERYRKPKMFEDPIGIFRFHLRA